jgi:nitrate reductase NapAB chaperone NapD
MTVSQWSVSGLCITARPEELATVRAVLNDRPGVEVQASDPARGRLVVTQECATLEDHRDGLREIQALPGVLTADLVVHYRDPGTPPQPEATGEA